MANAPVDKIVAGNVTITVWENEVKKGKDSFKAYSLTIQKNYKDGDTWKSTGSFQYKELPFVVMAIEEAMRRKYIREDEVNDVSFD